MLKYCMVILIIFSGELFAQNPSTSCIPVVIISENQNNICSGTAITIRATVTNEGTNGVYKWKKNNSDAGANAGASYTTTDFNDSDAVLCEYSCKTPCGDTTVVSNSITIHILNDITPSITIANYDPLICEGVLTVFKASAYYGDAIPFYHWTVNGSTVGSNSPVFSTSTITNGAQVECVLTISTPSCPGTSKSATSKMAIYVYPLVHPAITITPSKTWICRGEAVIFTAKANGGAFPAFTWIINGKPTGADGPSLTTSTLQEGDTISCIITVDQDTRCRTGISAPSNDVIMHVHDYINPTLKIGPPTSAVCPDEDVTFTAAPQNPGVNKFYQWQINGRNAGYNSPTFTHNQFANGDTVSCTLTTDIPGCPFTASVSSNNEVVPVKAIPVITFIPPDITILSGESAQLHASVSGSAASHLWRPGDILITPESLTSSTIPLMHDTVFNLSVVDTNGCAGSNTLSVKVLHKLYIPSAFTPNKDGENDVFRIPPGASISLSEFSVFDRWGNVVFKTSDITKGWNGTYQGRDLDTGTYVYLIKGVVQDKPVIIKGTATLIR